MAEAVAVQKQLQRRVRIEDDFGPVQTIAGVDVGYDPRQGLSRAVIVLMDKERLEPDVSVFACSPTAFPYVPGLLSFREIPVILEAFACLPRRPDLLFVDGQGIAHPRRLGIAAHLGVLLDIPAIGVAKSRLTGQYEEPDLSKGDSSALTHKNERIGTVLRSRDRVKPLFISPGHRVSQDMAVHFVMKTLTRYRLPEPTRLADKLTKA